ncbi:MAG TPA: class I SAM-dependent methyltransferase [Gaiellaceae bacterium]
MRLWHEVVAAGYDAGLARAEERGLGEARRSLLAGAHGRVLELGAGTGLNVRHYPAGAEVTFTEPDPAMAKRLRRRAKVVVAPAEALPFADASFDIVVATLVFCTVRDVPAALRETRRVLAPGGRLLFLEHVRAEPGTPAARWQQLLHRPWHALACGCNCNRDFLAALAAENYAVSELRRESWPFLPAIVRPVVIGAASVS